MSTSLVAACIQLTARDSVQENLETCARLCAQARARGAELAVLPENFALVGTTEHEKLAAAETIGNGPIVGALADMATRHGMWIIGGGMPERSDAPGKVFNTLVAVAPSGRIAARYRKMHLFDVDIPAGAQFRESQTVCPGDEPTLLESPWGKIGLSICYDLRFPELYRRLVHEGARIIVVPAAFTLHTGKDHWHVLLRARAIENTAYLLAAGQFGKHNEKRTCYGHSMIVDPWGTILAEAPDRECAVVAELDFPFQDKIRRELPSLSHRRL
ncbi:MAG: carbon-nitrogen hydrolase family protein [Deltaproteobacteria bacterium]|nr:carbon-nitrogen hydrolase family protein [Deltaproteobacteria bacterium]